VLGIGILSEHRSTIGATRGRAPCRFMSMPKQRRGEHMVRRRPAGYRPYAVGGDEPEPHDGQQGQWSPEQLQRMDQAFRQPACASCKRGALVRPGTLIGKRGYPPSGGSGAAWALAQVRMPGPFMALWTEPGSTNKFVALSRR
jgi:hypothetical protein